MLFTCTWLGTAGIMNDEEEKEVDPSLVGSLDNVYTEETEAAMNKEDPFKIVPVMDKESTPAEIEKTVNALVMYSSEGDDSNDCSSPLPGEENSLNLEYVRSSRNSIPVSPPGQREGVDLDLLSPSYSSASETGMTPGGVSDRGLSGSQELLPDVISDPLSGMNSDGPLPDVQQQRNRSNHTHSLPPDIAPHGTLPPDLAAVSQHPLDLLNPEGSGSWPEQRGPLDLTEGIPRESHP